MSALAFAGDISFGVFMKHYMFGQPWSKTKSLAVKQVHGIILETGLLLQLLLFSYLNVPIVAKVFADTLRHKTPNSPSDWL